MPVHSEAEAVPFLRTAFVAGRLDRVLLNVGSGPALIAA